MNKLLIILIILVIGFQTTCIDHEKERMKLHIQQLELRESYLQGELKTCREINNTWSDHYWKEADKNANK